MASVFTQTSNSFALTDGTTYYGTISPTNQDRKTTEADAQIPWNTAGVWSRIGTSVIDNPVTGTTNIKSRIDGADGNQVIAITGSTTGFFEDTSNSDTLSGGEKINISGLAPTQSGTNTASCYVGRSLFAATSGTVKNFGTHLSQDFNAASTTEYARMTGNSLAGDASSTLRVVPFPVAGTATNFYVVAAANARTNNTVFSMSDEAGTGLGPTVTVTGSTTGQFVDTSNTATLAVDDQIVLKGVTLTGTQVLSVRNGFEFVSTSDSEFPFVVARNSTIGYNFTRIIDIDGMNSTTIINRVEGTYAQSTTMELGTMNVDANTADGTGTLTLQVNGSASSMAISIASLATGKFQDSSNTVDVVDGDTIYWTSSVAGTTGNIGFLSITLVGTSGGAPAPSAFIPRVLSIF